MACSPGPHPLYLKYSTIGTGKEQGNFPWGYQERSHPPVAKTVQGHRTKGERERV